jgi:proteasome lid subunit RPN8/RPN11
MLKLQASDYDKIRRHGEETYPNECCGILVGTSEGDVRTVRSAIRCNNVRADSPQTRYDIDPRDLVRIQREAHENGSTLSASTTPTPIIPRSGRQPI